MAAECQDARGLQESVLSAGFFVGCLPELRTDTEYSVKWKRVRENWIEAATVEHFLGRGYCIFSLPLSVTGYLGASVSQWMWGIKGRP